MRNGYEGRLLARGALVLPALLVAAALGAGGGAARADDAGAPAPHEPALTAVDAGPSRSGCVLEGTYPVAKGTTIFDAASGGRAIGGFTGAFASITMRDLPADPATGRARVATSNGTPALRIEGFADPRGFELFTTRDLPVSGGHVWVSSAQHVKMIRFANDQITAELTIGGSQDQKVRVTAPCDAFALERAQPAGMDVPGNARGYLMKTSTIELYDEPKGDVVLALQMIEGTGQLFWSTEMRAGFVHVQSRADLTIDAWARYKDLDPLKKGEMRDQLAPPRVAVTGAQLALDKAPPLVKAVRDVPVRAKRDDKAKVVGAIETGAEVYLMETIAGWTNVLPKGLGVIPPEGEGFWIPASEAPK
jgi:hypothetical protein